MGFVLFVVAILKVAVCGWSGAKREKESEELEGGGVVDVLAE